MLNSTVLKIYPALKKALFSPLLPLCLIIFIDHMGFGIIYPILVPVFMGESSILGVESTASMQSFWYGITLAVFPLCLFFGATLLGSLSDFYGRKKILLVCLLGMGISSLLTGLAIDQGNIILLIVSRMVAGITAGSMPIAQAVVMDLSDDKEKASNLGIVILAGSLGFLMGPLAGGVFTDKSLVSWFELSTPLYLSAVLAFCNLYALKFLKETFVPKQDRKFAVTDFVKYFLAPITRPSIRFLAGVFLVMQLGWSFYFQFISVFLLKKFHYTAQDISLFMSMMGVGFGLGSSVGLKILSKYLSDVKLTLLSLVLVSMTVFMTITDVPIQALWLSSLLLGICMAIAYSMLIKLLSKTVSQDEQGFIMGVSEAIVSVAWAVTPLASAYLEIISVNVPIIASSILLVLCTGLLYIWARPESKNNNIVSSSN